MYSIKTSITVILFLFSITIICQNQRIDVNHIIDSDNLNENRIIEVSIPLDYNHTQKIYPVLYLLDGEYIFDYAKGAINFLSNPFGYLPRMILVSIPNTDRNRDLFVSVKADGEYLKFLDFLETEVVPFINSQYRTNGFSIIYGWSSGSGICSYLLANNPQLFDGYILSGTAIGSKSSEMLTTQIPLHNYNNKFLYATTEGTKYLNLKGEGPRIEGLNKYSSLIKKLKPEGLRWKFSIEKDQTHVGVMTKTLYDGLNFIFSDYYVPDSITLKGADQVISYFNDINSNYSFDVEIPVGTIIESASILLQEKQKEEVLKLLMSGKVLHPFSPDIFGALGEFYEYDDNIELAIKYYKLALEKSNSDIKSYLKYKSLIERLSKL